MIPILFENTETEFTSQGLGSLTDAIKCTVTENRNGSFELEMTYPLGGLHYEDIQYGRIILAKPSDGAEAEPFDIYKITRPISGKVTVYARHISYRLSYIATLPTTEQYSAQDALSALKSGAITNCPFSFSSNVFKEGTWQNEKTQSIRSLLGGQDGSVLDIFGGEYKWNRWAVSLLTARGSSIPVTLEYGKNLTDLQQEENIESTYTSVICSWSQELEDGSIKEVHGSLVYTDNHDLFPFDRTLVVDKSSDYQEEPSTDVLTSAAESYINSNGVGVPKVSIKISFVNLRDTEEYKDIAPLQTVSLCDTIKVRFDKLGVNTSAKIIKTVYDVLNERYDSIEVGDAKTSLAGTIANTAAEIETAERNMSESFKAEMRRATQIITGGLGGYVIIRRDETTGYPDEILIMDQPDKLTATNVIRMNKNGIGFSQNGYNGPFNSAWLIDGTFDATQIKAGLLTDFAGKFSLNMETGALIMKDATFQDGTVKITGATFGTNIDTTIDGNGIRTGYIYPDQIWAAPTFYANRNGDGALEVLRDLWINVYGTSTGAVRFYSSSEGTLTCIAANGGAASFWVDAVHVFAYVYHNNTEYVGWINDSGSDRRIKQEIKEIDAEESKRIIMGLKPVSFRFVKSDLRFDDRQSHHGFIAQDVKEVIGNSDWAVWDIVDNEPVEDLQTVRKDELIADLVKVVQDQEERIGDLEARLAKIEELVNGND